LSPHSRRRDLEYLGCRECPDYLDPSRPNKQQPQRLVAGDDEGSVGAVASRKDA
jgi:hypothetical protein